MAITPTDVVNYLFFQSVTFKRESFGGKVQLLADELFRVFANIPRIVDNLATVDENGNLIEIAPAPIPGLPGLNPIDLDLPPFFERPSTTVDFPTDPNQDDGEFPDPAVPFDPEDFEPVEAPPTEDEQIFWHRQTYPGKVLANNGFGEFSIRLYRNGFANITAGGEPNVLGPGSADNADGIINIDATITDPAKAEDVEIGTWVMVFMAMLVSVKGGDRPPDVGTAGPSPSEIRALNIQYLFNAPATGSTARWGTVSSAISGRDGDILGTGSVELMEKNEEGVWTTGDTEPVFSTVTGSISTGKVVQLKTIGGDLFVDVEDCGQEEEAEPSEG